MPLTIPTLDDRKYQQLLDEALARIPIHNPEWTNFNKSDPGVTLIELFAFLTENLLYRCNLIPERNRRKFLTLIGVPLRPAASARGIVTFSNERGPLQTTTLNSGAEVRSGTIPFRTELGLDIVPIEGRVYYKRTLSNPSQDLTEYYNQLYSSLRGQPPTAKVSLYETALFKYDGTTVLDLGKGTVDGSLWIALLARDADKSYSDDMLPKVRTAIEGKTLNIGILPSLTDGTRTLKPGGEVKVEGQPILKYEIPNIPSDGGLPTEPTLRVPAYKPLEARSDTDVLSEPGIVQLTLPKAAELTLWNNLDPLEPGAGEFPPALNDSKLEDRLVTWIRIRSTAAVDAKLLWVGLNAVFVTQRCHVANEVLPNGSGEPDQSVTLTKTPVVPESVQLTVTLNGVSEIWEEIDDLLSAGSEVPIDDLRQPPGVKKGVNGPTKVFVLDPESGTIKFGDGVRGARPPYGATVRAEYDYSVGRDGNLGVSAINAGASLPPGIKVTNPVQTWGGSQAETVTEGEKQISRYLQHRERLVTVEDFKTIIQRTPGIDVARVEVLPAYNPELNENEPGDAPGAVTAMVIPKYDVAHPETPSPDNLFLDAICKYIEPARLVTTEVYLRGPTYKQIWISVGINVMSGTSVAQVREDVKKALLRYLSPLPEEATESTSSCVTETQSNATVRSGWPLRKSVVDVELLAEANRVTGVLSVNKVLLAEGTGAAVTEVEMQGLELPQVAGILITPGEAADLDLLRGTAVTGGTVTGGTTTTTEPTIVSVPVIPEECC